MKTLKSILVTIVLFSIASNAQITKGNWMVGGNGSFSSTSYETTNSDGSTNKGKVSQLAVFPNIGYFIVNNFACGLSGNFYLSLPENGVNSTSFGGGPFVRYYFLKPEKKINILSQVSYYYASNSDSPKSYNRGYNFKAGPVFYINRIVGLELTMDYNNSKISNPYNDTTRKDFTVSLGLQIHLKK